jgi:hypothetical protein
VYRETIGGGVLYGSNEGERGGANCQCLRGEGNCPCEKVSEQRGTRGTRGETYLQQLLL